MIKLPNLRWIHYRMLAAFAGVAAFSLPALASLGGNADSVEADRAHMNASEAVTQNNSYTVHAIQSPDGTVVNEYVSAAGTVFGVAWHGRFFPDMQQILGTYFSQYSAALASQPKHYGHRQLNIKQSGLVVQTAGHMHDYFGRAYIPSLLPQGLNPDQLQ